jgi:prepilin-type processing-associated H-X9-DG protein
VGVALHNHISTQKELPYGMLDNGGFWGWSMYLLPYMEEQAVYDLYTIKAGNYWSGPPSRNREASKTWISAFLCPNDPQAHGQSEANGIPISTATPNELAALSNMCGVSDSVEWMTPNNSRPRRFPEADGVFGANESCGIAKIVDGTSKTLAVGEAAGGGEGSKVGNFWATWNLKDTSEGINGPHTAPGGKYPSDAAGPGTASDSAGFSSWHPGACHFLLADGSVHFVSENIAQVVLAALTTRNGPSPSNLKNYPSKVFSPEAVISGPPW